MEKVTLRRRGVSKSRFKDRSKKEDEGCCDPGDQAVVTKVEDSSAEKGPSNGELLGGPTSTSTTTDPTNGCPSSTTLSRGNKSCSGRPETPQQNHQSMPVTSRSKRLRGATTSSPYNKIAFTDRKTRSSSSSLIVDNNTVVIKSEVPSSRDSSPPPADPFTRREESGVSQDNAVVDGTIGASDTKLVFNCSGNGAELDGCGTEVGPCKEGILSETVKSEVPSETNFAGSETKLLPSGSVDWNTSSASTNPSHELSQHHNNNNNPSNANHNDIDTWEVDKVVIAERSESKQRAGERPSAAFKSDAVVVESSRKRSKPASDQKLTLAPMLLMNNLPYMGELTFDTRPRRGRKPKKADICHLISKNYGIHFPNSYTNVPNTGTPPTATTAASYSSSPKTRTPKVNPSIKGKSSKRNSSKSGTISTCPPSSWTIAPPDLLPIATSGQSHFSELTRTFSIASSKISTSTSKSHQSGGKGSSKSAHKGITNKTPTNPLMSKVMGQDEPLNLCVRDAGSQNSQINSPSHSALSSFNASYPQIMNLKLPLTSPNSLFTDFHLNQVGNRMSHTSDLGRGFNESIKKSKYPQGGSSGNKNDNKSNSSETVHSDPSLVNNISLQLNLVNNFHGNGPIPSKSRGKTSHALPPVPSHRYTVDEPGIHTNSQHKKGRKRKSPILKSDEFNQADPKSSSHVPSSSNNFLSSSSAPSSTISNLESHAGGCLFGQSDSGINSGAQVSICKFKFTGGAKPSLQEKKMLSVDSGGNFRFYTDKSGSASLKSLKSCHSGINSQGSGTPYHNSLETYGEQDCQYAFSALPKSAKSMSVCMPVRSTSLQTTYSPVATTSSASGSRLPETQKSPTSLSLSPASMELHNLHLESNSRSGSGSGHVPSTFPPDDGFSSSQSENSNSGIGMPSSESVFGSNLSVATVSPFQHEGRSKLSRFKRKRRTRKSLMREKLEKTFKEKGFLIQTQQLESAEGATYCKFRQLRKFTRYLFRSWKDYLPDNVRDINAPGANKGDVSGTAVNLATSSAGGNPGGGASGSGMEMELDLTTTNSQVDLNDSREGSDEEDNEEDCEGMDQYSGGIPAPEVILTTQPPSPVKNLSGNDSNNDDDNGDDSAVSNDDVDVENIDATSDNSSLQYNPTINIQQQNNNDNSADSDG